MEMNLTPTRKAVSQSWEAYAALRQAEAKDPALGLDPEFIGARNRAHRRWSKAFLEWDGC